jgi:small basic protein
MYSCLAWLWHGRNTGENVWNSCLFWPPLAMDFAVVRTSKGNDDLQLLSKNTCMATKASSHIWHELLSGYQQPLIFVDLHMSVVVGLCQQLGIQFWSPQAPTILVPSCVDTVYFSFCSRSSSVEKKKIYILEFLSKLLWIVFYIFEFLSKKLSLSVYSGNVLIYISFWYLSIITYKALIHNRDQNKDENESFDRHFRTLSDSVFLKKVLILLPCVNYPKSWFFRASFF